MSKAKGNMTHTGHEACAVSTAACAGILAGTLAGLISAGVAAQQASTPVGPAESVIGGNDAPAGAFPSVVALVKQGRFSPAGRQFCGGTIVETTWVLTAAHCLFDSDTNQQLEASTLRVIGGIENLRFDSEVKETVVTNIIVHPSYSHATSTQNDIALLELATPLAEPISPLYLGERDALDGIEADIVGWGATYFVSPTLAEYPDQLQTAVVPIVSQAVCNSPESYDNALIDSQMCAGFPEGGIDTCAGDSGGPLYVNINGVREQAGIVSFGRGCAEPNLYGIYTSVPAFATWLSQYITIDKGQPRAPTSKPVDLDGEDTNGEQEGEGTDGDSNPFLSVGGGGGGAPDIYLLAVVLLLLRRRAALKISLSN